MSEEINYAETDNSELLDLVVAELEHQGMEDVATELKEVIKQASNEKEFLAILNDYSGAFLGKEYLSLGRLDLRGEKEEAKKEKE